MKTVEDSAFIPDSSSRTSISWKSQWIGMFGLLALLAFTWLPNSYAYMVGWPYAIAWQTAFLTLSSYALWLCRKFSIPLKRIGYGLDVVVVFTMIVSIFSTLNSQFRAVACWNLLLIINYAICLYLLVNWLRSRSLTRHSLWAILAGIGTVTSIIGLALWRPSSSMWLSEDFYTAIRNAQPLGHHNFVGGYELLLLPIVVSFALSQKIYYKWIALAASGIVATTVYISGSRGALIGMIVLGTTSVALGIISNKSKARRYWAITGICFALIMSLALVSNPRMRTLLSVTPAVDENKLSVVSVVDGPTKDRVFMFESALNILKTHPILGVGPGNLSRVYDTYRPIEAGTGLSLIQQLHNTPAQLAAELGILGLCIYILVLVSLIRLGISLHKRITKGRDRLLLYGIGGSWLGYGISSLSDYQLENIGITSTLVATIALLVNLADSYKPHTRDLNLSKAYRRIISTGLIVVVCANVQMWLRVDAGLYLSHSAIRSIQEADFVSADSKWAKASKLVPWDPTYSALAAEAALDLAREASSEKDAQELTLLAASYFEDALMAAPNDPWFNQNLAVLLLESDTEDAERYARHAVSIAPRSTDTYTYYTLGMSLLNQGKIDKAISAFTLEALANPSFLTDSVWEHPPLLLVKDDVVEATLEDYRQILSETNQESLQYKWLYDQLVLLSWWYDYSIDTKAEENASVLTRAIVAADRAPQKSLGLIDEYINQNGRSVDIHLLQARLAPDKYLLELIERTGVTGEEKSQLQKSVRSEGSLKEWFTEARTVTKGQIRNGVIFAYRNISANNIQTILHPEEIQINMLPDAISLFQNAPREYPQLDRYMDSIRTKQL